MAFVDEAQLKQLGGWNNLLTDATVTCHNCEQEYKAYSPEVAKIFFSDQTIDGYVCDNCGFYAQPVILTKRKIETTIKSGQLPRGLLLRTHNKNVGDATTNKPKKRRERTRLISRAVIYLPKFTTDKAEVEFLRQIAELLRKYPGDDAVLLYDKKGDRWARYETESLTVKVCPEFEQEAWELLGTDGFQTEILES